jgi:hypothetical protein
MPTFASNQDLYDFTRALADHARQLGDDTIAARLKDALYTGSTASEVLGDLRVALRAIRTEIDDRYPPETGGRLDAAIKAIDQAFRGAT